MKILANIIYIWPIASDIKQSNSIRELPIFSAKPPPLQYQRVASVAEYYGRKTIVGAKWSSGRNWKNETAVAMKNARGMAKKIMNVLYQLLITCGRTNELGQFLGSAITSTTNQIYKHGHDRANRLVLMPGESPT
jgi:hypothetical protein